MVRAPKVGQWYHSLKKPWRCVRLVNTALNEEQVQN